MTFRGIRSRRRRGSGRRWVAVPLALGLLATFGWPTGASGASPADANSIEAPALGLAPATVSVDFDSDEGRLLRTERYNNFASPTGFATQRPADVRYLDRQGLAGSIYRVWFDNWDQGCTTTTGTCTLTPSFRSYLTDASNVSDSILGNVGHLDNFITPAGPSAVEPKIQRFLLAAKQAFPALKYVESWNEPDAPGTKITPTQVYQYYVPLYEAVDNINAELRAKVQHYVPLQLGGPTFSDLDQSWFQTFFAAYAADSNHRKHLDFISYHGYFNRDSNGNFDFYKGNPSLVANQRSQLVRMLQANHLDTNIPSFVTETGIYPGPLCDQCNSTDYARNAAGMASLHYWYANQPNTYPFNWVDRHSNQALKDEFVTRNSTGPYMDFTNPLDPTPLWPNLDPIPTGTFTPYGNMMLMQSMMKDERVSAISHNLTNGSGVYAVASKGQNGASLMVWNYQGCNGTPPQSVTCPSTGYRTTINLANMPADLSGHPVHVRLYRIDQNTSNYFSDPAHAELQQVEEKTVEPGSTYIQTVNLQPDAIYLILFDRCDLA